MFRNILRSRLLVSAVSCVALALSCSIGLAQAEELCSITPSSYSGAKSSYPHLTTAIDTLEKYAIASWFTDRQSRSDRSIMISSILSQCSEDSRLSIVVYGIPNKDCAGGYSSGGSVQSTSDYQSFLKELTDAVGDRKVLYVVEPDALGLLAEDGGCGSSAGYLDNLKIAVTALSANANAELYLDVGYWMLAYESNAGKVATAMKDIGSSGRVKGVTINTSNYRSNDEVAGYCTTFQAAMGSNDMHCIVDTSRNFNGSPTSDWCNVPTAGIGKPPTSETGYSNLDYFMWIKPPGESDGECSSGPAAGSFFSDGFKLLWDQGYFVKDLGMATVDASSTSIITEAPTTLTPSTTAPETTVPTTAPTITSSAGSSDSAPGTVAPADGWTDAPSTAAPTTATPNATTPSHTSPTTSSPSTTAPATTAPVTSYPSATAPVKTAAPTTTAPAGETETSQTSTTQARSACKSKKASSAYPLELSPCDAYRTSPVKAIVDACNKQR